MSLPKDMPPEVYAVYIAAPEAAQAWMLALRAVIFEIAEVDARVGQVCETLKWGQPAYLTQGPKTGTTIRIAEAKSGGVGLYVPCSTTLIQDFRDETGGDFICDGNRGVLFAEPLGAVPAEIQRLIHSALVYHVKG